MAFDYNTVPAGYYDLIFQKKSGCQSKWHDLKFQEVRKSLGTNYTRHLDVGCGPGTLIGTLDGSGTSVGVDVSEEQIKYATTHYGSQNREFHCISPGVLPFPDNHFDVVTIIEVIEHLKYSDVENVLREIWRVLDKNGKLILTTPNYRGIWPLLEWVVNLVGDLSYEEQHVTHFHKRKIRSLLPTLGFNIDRIQTFQGPAFAAAYISWRFSDLIADIESRILRFGGGALLLAEASKVGQPG